MKTKAILVAVLAAFTVAAVAPEAHAQQPPPKKRRGNFRPEGIPGPRPTPPEAPPQLKKKPSSGKITAVVGGDVHTVTREVVRNAVLLIQDGKFLRVGQEVEIPEGATVIDAKGKVVTPGFVALSTANVGLQLTGAGKFSDALDPYDRDMKFCLGAGITTAVTEVSQGFGGRRRRSDDGTEEAPEGQAVCPCCGMAFIPYEPIFPARAEEPTPKRHAVLKFTYGDLESMFVSETPFHHLNAGALTGPENKHAWRENFRKAREYLKAQAAHEEAVKNGQRTPPPTKTVGDEMLKLAKKEIALRTDASSVGQIRDMIALAKELDYRLILDGVEEGWLTADELSAAKVSVVFTPRSSRRPRPGYEETTGSYAETAGRFEKAGVNFALKALSPSVSLDGIPGRDLTSLPLEAAFAVRGGAKEKTALAALTIVPAQMLGMADRIGSIEEGKDADLLILDGPPLDYRTYVEKAVIGGKVYYDRHIDRCYPDPLPANLKQPGN
jgi:imidazolonepropionase-like amidohydrolase